VVLAGRGGKARRPEISKRCIGDTLHGAERAKGSLKFVAADYARRLAMDQSERRSLCQAKCNIAPVKEHIANRNKPCTLAVFGEAPVAGLGPFESWDKDV
jgi:hypothetical protein